MYSRNKKLLLTVALIAMLAGCVVYVAADSASGTVTVDPEKPIIKDISFPLIATPADWLTLTFTLQYQTGLGQDDLYIDFYSALAEPNLVYGSIPSITVNLFDHYRAKWINTPNDPWKISGTGYGPDGVFQNPSTNPLPMVSDGTDIQFSLDVRFDELADATNPWTIKFHLKYGSSQSIDAFYEFDLAAYLGLNIVESTFDFGNIEQGQVLIPISLPTQGYLSLAVQSNTAYMIQVYGSDPLFGAETFSVSNIWHNSINETSSAIPLSLESADVANLIEQPLTPIGTEDYLVLYLWISIPIEAVLGTYTFTLTEILISM